MRYHPAHLEKASAIVLRLVEEAEDVTLNPFFNIRTPPVEVVTQDTRLTAFENLALVVAALTMQLLPDGHHAFSGRVRRPAHRGVERRVAFVPDAPKRHLTHQITGPG